MAHRSLIKTAVTAKPKVIGLKNLGNSCYKNLIIQCLFHTCKLSQELVGNLKAVGILNPSSRFWGRIAGTVGGAFDLMRCRCGNPVSLIQLKSTVDGVYEPFRGSRQQDSHEFLMKMVTMSYNERGASKTC